MKPQNMNSLLEDDKKYYLQVYARYPLALKKGKGAIVWDVDGNKYLDAFSGIAVNSLGHAHPAVVKAIYKQAKRLIHISNFYASEPQVELSKKLVEISGMDRAFFCNSGAEAMEGAFKLARKYAHKQGKGGTIISMENCFHGRTLATIAAGKEIYQKGFEPIPAGFMKVPFNNFEALTNAVTDDTAAIVIEPIQGEGGIFTAGKEYLSKVRALCDEKNIVLIFDEIQCGIARTGTFFGYEHIGVMPDIITMAKGLAAGFPIGGILLKQKVADSIGFGEHGTTFGGNPLACAAGLATVNITSNPKFLQKVKEKGDYMLELLREKAKNNAAIKDIRGTGLMIGVELDIEGRNVVNEMLKLGVLSNVTAVKTIRLVPPLVISKKEIKKIVDVLFKALEEVQKNG